MENGPSPKAVERKRALWKRPLAWILALLFTLLVLAALAPMLGAGFAAGKAEQFFAARHAGKLDVEGVALSWTSRQKVERVTLADPTGGEVARAKLELPSLWDLLSGRGKRLGKLQVEFDADLVADEQGVTNLDRALAPKHPSAPDQTTDSKGGSEGGGSMLDALDLEVELVSKRISWTDATTRQLGAPLSIENLKGALVLRPGEPLSLRLSGGVLGKPEGKLNVDAKVSQLSSAAPTFELEADVAGLPSAMIDALARQDGLVREVLGPEFSLRARGNGTLQAGDLALDLSSERTALSVRSRLEAGVLSSRADAADGTLLTLQTALTSGLAQALAARFVPPEAKLSFVDQPEPARFELRVQRLRWNLERALGRLEQARPLELIDDLAAEISVVANGVRVEHPALESVGAGTLRAARVSVELAPVDGRTRAKLHAELDATANPGADAVALLLSVDGPALDPQALLASDQALGALELEGKLDGLSAALAQRLGVPPDLAPLLGTHRTARLRGQFDIGAALGSAGQDSKQVAQPFQWPARVDGALTLEIPAASSAPAPAAPELGLVQLEVKLARAAPSVATIALRTGLRAAAPTSVTVDGHLARWPQAWPLDLTDPAQWPELDLALGSQAIDVAWLEQLAGRSGVLAPVLGARIDALDLEASSKNGVQRLSFQLDADRAAKQNSSGLAAAGTIEHDAKAMRAYVPAGAAGPSAHFDSALLAAFLPPALAQQLPIQSGAIDVKLDELDLPTAPWRARLLGAGQAPLDLGQALQGVRAQLVFSARAAGDAFLSLPEYGLSVRESAGRVSIEPAASKSKLASQIEVKLAGGAAMNLRVEAENLVQLAALATSAQVEPVGFEAVLEQFPTKFFERWAGPALAARVGDRIDVKSNGKLHVERSRLRSDFAFDLSAGGKNTQCKGSLGATDLFAASASLPPLEADLSVRGLALAAQFLPPERAQELEQIVGDELLLRVENKAGASGATQASLRLEGKRIRLAAAGQSAQGVLSMHGADQLELVLEPTQELLDRAVAGSLPAGAKLALSPGTNALKLVAREVELGIGLLTGAAGASLESTLAGAQAQAEIDLPGLIYTHPAAQGAAEGTAVPLSGGKVSLTLAPASGLDLRMSAQVAAAQASDAGVEAGPGAGLQVQARVPDPAAWLSSDPARRASARAQASGQGKGLPTALIDAFAAQDGLLVDALGSEIEFSFEGAWPATPAQALTAKLRSSKAKLDLHANWQDMALDAGPEQGLSAELPLSPLVQKRVVGALVPLLVNVSKPEGARPVGLSAKSFHLPLDGDLSKLDAEVVLDLNEILYALLPELDRAFDLAGAGVAKRTTLAPLTLKIEKGVMRYDRIPISLGGQDLLLDGTVDLAARKYALRTKVPLATLGKKVEKELDSVRDYLDPKMLVPLELGGTWDKPRLRVGKDFLEDVVKRAAEGAARKGLEDLLGGKKKKD